MSEVHGNRRLGLPARIGIRSVSDGYRGGFNQHFS